ncbi:hypothetical protein H4S01_002100 [Coemansia sp. RSA 2610]|nr:hypothetical protein H4S01_002100 [Coemansia sp. RSA 2610]
MPAEPEANDGARRPSIDAVKDKPDSEVLAAAPDSARSQLLHKPRPPEQEMTMMVMKTMTRMAMTKIPDMTHDNLIVICEGKCGLAFHQRCYGIEEVPPGDEPWYCDLCAGGSSSGPNAYRKNLYCCHYKNDRTARKLVITDRPTEVHFVHVQCAAFISSVDTSHIPFTTDVPKIKGNKSKCCFCSGRFGCMVYCSHKARNIACESAFHPMCAIRHRFLAPPTLYTTKFHHFLCPDHSPAETVASTGDAEAEAEGSGAAKRPRDADPSVPDEVSKIGRRTSQPFQSPRARATRRSSAPRGRPRLHRGSPSSNSPRGRPPTRGGKRGRPPLRNRGLSRAERELDIVEDDEAELSHGEAPAKQSAVANTRGRGRGRLRYIESTDENEETSDIYTNGSMSLSARTDSSEMILANGRVDMPRPMHTASPDMMDDREHTALNSLANAALGTPHGSANGYGPRETRRITLTFGGQPASRSGSTIAAGSPISPAYLNQHRNSLNSIPSGQPQQGGYAYGYQNSMRPPKRPSIHIRPFSGSGGSAAHFRGSIPPPQQMPSPRHFAASPAAAAGAYDSIPHSPVSARLSVEQEKLLKDSHDMLQKQSEVLQAIQDAVKELSAHPSRQAQTAMSKISSLSALISGSSSSSAQTTPSMTHHGGATFQSRPTPGPSTSNNSASANMSSRPLTLTEVAAAQLPKPALSFGQLYRNGASEKQPAGAQQSRALPAAPSLPSQIGGFKSTATREASFTEAEIDELKANMIFLLKRVNIPQILLNMLTPKSEGGSGSGGEGRGQAFTALVADLKRLGGLSKDNLQDYLRAFVRSLESPERSGL